MSIMGSNKGKIHAEGSVQVLSSQTCVAAERSKSKHFLPPHPRRRNTDSFCFFIFYWSTVGIQCCVCYRRIEKWISYTHICYFLDSFPIEAITEHWAEFSVLYIRSLLAIYFISSGRVGFELHKPSRPALAQLQDWRKSPESATEPTMI